MAVVRVQARLVRDSGLPEDEITNTWHFTTQDNLEPGRSTQATLAMNQVENFYTTIGARLASYLTGTGEMRAYDLADPEPRVPFLTLPIVFVPATAPDYPGEVAVTMSFQGVAISGTNQARRRGRIFVGPVSDIGINVPAGMQVDNAARNAIAAAGGAVLDASQAAADWSWIVFSPTSAGPENADGTFANLAQGVVVIDNGWVDDAFDTIRSRGRAATARTLFS